MNKPTNQSNSTQDTEEANVSNLDPVHDALNRMKRAYERQTGCHLTERMIEALGRSFLGQAWAEEDPRLKAKAQQ